MQVAGAVGGALGITDGITVSKSSGYDTTRTSEEVTDLEGSNIYVGGNNVKAYGTDFKTTAIGGGTYVLGNDVSLGVATTTIETQDYDQKEVVGGEGIKFTNDSLQLGAITRTDIEDSTTITTGTNQGVTINSDNITVLGGMDNGTLTTTAATLNANPETGNLVLGAKTTILDGIENTQIVTNNNTTDTTKVSAEVRHIAVDAVKAAEQVKEAGSAVAHAKNDLKDAKARAARGELSQDAIKDYEINLAAAGVNLVNAQINLGSTAVAAAGTSLTGGFSASANAEHSKTVSTDTQKTGTWQGTELNAANTTFVGDDFTVIGGTGNLGALNIDNLTSLTLKSGTNTTTSSSNSQTNAQTASINTAGNVGLGLSTQKSSAQSSSSTPTNTEFKVDSFDGHADSTTLNGGRIDISGASEGSYSTNKLHIETVQNTSESSNKSKGANIGINANISTGAPIPTGGSLGANKSTGTSQSSIAAEQSGIIYTSDNHALSAKDTTNIGGIIANIQTDSEGNQSSGTLNFTTDTLTTKDITNTATNNQRNLGGSIGVGTGQQGQSINNVGLQVGHTANEFESVTKATIGEGAIVTSDAITGKDSLAGVNRDALNTEIIIKDQQTAGLGVDANIDARVFTEAGRTEIIQEQKELLNNIETIENNVEGSATLSYEITKDVYNSVLILKKIEEVRATLTPEEQVIFDNELRKLQTEESLKSNVAPVVIGIGAGVTIGAAEMAAAGAAGGVYICSQVDVCSETVANGLNNSYDNAKAGSQAVQDYVVGIFSKNTASEDFAKEVGRKVGKDLGKDKQRELHDMKTPGDGDRTKDEIKEDARELYDEAGKSIPDWLK